MICTRMIKKKDEFIQLFKIVLGQSSLRGKELNKFFHPNISYTTFAFSSVPLPLLLQVLHSTCMRVQNIFRHFSRRPILSLQTIILVAHAYIQICFEFSPSLLIYEYFWFLWFMPVLFFIALLGLGHLVTPYCTGQ